MREFIFQVVWMSCFIGISNSIICYDCRSDDSTCNVGQCHGMSCLKMETSNMDNDRRTVHKGCSDDPEPTQCKQSGFGSKLITRCSCETDYCNGDELLTAAGLVNTSPSKPSLAFNSIYFLLFSFIFHNFNSLLKLIV